MRTIRIRALSLALFTLTFVGVAAAEDKPSTVLNALEVRQLIAHGASSDHARLASHFAALAEQYTAEATRHTAMAQHSVGNPSRNLSSTALSAHCQRLAELNTQSATVVRELAAYHQQRANGATPTAPADAAGFQRGAGAPAPNDQALSALAASAQTLADHQDLEGYFLTLAKRYSSEAGEHAAMARAYQGLPRSTSGGATAVHCEQLARSLREAAKEATAAAVMHRNLVEASH